MSRLSRAAIEAAVDEYRPTYRLARELARTFMKRTGVNQNGLAHRIGEDPSYVSRFLHPESGHEPSRFRPAMVRVTEKILLLCDTRDDFRNERLELDLEVDTLEVDNFEILYAAHWHRLCTLREKLDPVSGLLRSSELVAVALITPGFIKRMCANTLLTLAAILGRTDIGQCSDSLLNKTLRDIDELERTGLRHVRSGGSSSVPESRIIGYSGMAKAAAAIRLQNARVTASGLEQVLWATSRPHSVDDGHWHNALSMADYLLEVSHPSAEAWSQRVAELARRNRGAQALIDALATRRYKNLRRFWSRTAADLLTPDWKLS